MQNLIDLHTHSVLSKHAFSSVTENIEYAHKKGLKYYGISEHQYDEYDIGAHRYSFGNLLILPKYYEGMRVLRGVEMNILSDGTIDMSKVDKEDLDYGIASIHSFCYKEKGYDANTENYLKVLENDRVHILGHIDDFNHPCYLEPVVQKAAETHKLIELNNSSLRERTYRINCPENIESIIKLALKYDLPLLINSDAHVCYDVGNYEDVLKIIDRVQFPYDRILNFNEQLIQEYFK